jgi:hypothetical protein
MTLRQTAKVLLSIEARSVLQEGVNAGVIPSKILENIDLSYGTSEGNIDLAWATTETAIAASTTTTYDLTSETFLSEARVFKEVVLIAVRNKRETAAAYLSVGPDSSDGFGATGPWADASDRSRIGPEGWFVQYDPVGWTVDATHKVLDVITSAVAGATNSWDIIVLGRSS